MIVGFKSHIRQCTECRITATGWRPCRKAQFRLKIMSVADAASMFIYANALRRFPTRRQATC